MSKQRFHRGDLVRIADDLGPTRTHFACAQDAIVVSSFLEQYGGSEDHTPEYTLFLRNQGEVSWYEEEYLTMVAPDQRDLLKQWRQELQDTRKQQSDLDWIFTHGSFKDECPGASVEALARCLGIANLWGSRGEGFTYYENALKIIAMASPYLEHHDKAGWLAFCATHQIAPGLHPLYHERII